MQLFKVVALGLVFAASVACGGSSGPASNDRCDCLLGRQVYAGVPGYPANGVTVQSCTAMTRDPGGPSEYVYCNCETSENRRYDNEPACN